MRVCQQLNEVLGGQLRNVEPKRHGLACALPQLSINGFSAASLAARLAAADPLLRRSLCAAGQPACPQVSRGVRLSGSDRDFPALTCRSDATGTASDLRTRRCAPVRSAPSRMLRKRHEAIHADLEPPPIVGKAARVRVVAGWRAGVEDGRVDRVDLRMTPCRAAGLPDFSRKSSPALGKPLGSNPRNLGSPSRLEFS